MIPACFLSCLVLLNSLHSVLSAPILGPALQEVDLYLSPFIAPYPPIPQCRPIGQASTTVSALARRLQGSSLSKLESYLACQTAAGTSTDEQSNLRATGFNEIRKQGHLKSCGASGGQDSISDQERQALDALTKLSAAETTRNVQTLVRSLQSTSPYVAGPEYVQNFLQLIKDELRPVSTILGATEIGLCVAAELKLGRSPATQDDITGTPLSGIPNVGDILCKCQGRVLIDRGRCSALNTAKLAIGCVAEIIAICPFPKVATPPLLPQGISLPMQPLASTPNAIPNDVILKEAATLRNLVTAVFAFYLRVGRYPCRLAGTQGDTEPEQPLLDGWSELRSFTAIEEGLVSKRQRLPFAVLATRRNAEDTSLNDYVIIIRGTATEGEWRLNFAFDQILGDLVGFPGALHKGFASIAMLVWPAIQSILGKDMLEGRLGYVTVTGHSLGSAVGGILAYLIGSYIPKINPKLKGPSTRAVLFAPPLIGSQSFVAALGSLVNLRSIVAELDAVPILPCLSIKECEELGGTKGKKISFAKFPGRIVIGASYLGYPWLEEETGLNVVAWHTCPYTCWASKITNEAGLTTDRYYCDKPITKRPLAVDMCGVLLPVAPEREDLAGSGVGGDVVTSDGFYGTLEEGSRIIGGAASFSFGLGGLPLEATLAEM